MTDLILAFNENATLEKSHMLEILEKYMCKQMINVFEEQYKFHDRLIVHLFNELPKIGFYNAELYDLLISTVTNKKRMQNIYFFKDIHNALHNLNENPKVPLYKKLDEKIKLFEEKFCKNDLGCKNL